jgi:hypothetical protein
MGFFGGFVVVFNFFGGVFGVVLFFDMNVVIFDFVGVFSLVYFCGDVWGCGVLFCFQRGCL